MIELLKILGAVLFLLVCIILIIPIYVALLLFTWIFFGWFFMLFPISDKFKENHKRHDFSTVKGRLYYWWADIWGLAPPYSTWSLVNELEKHICEAHSWYILDRQICEDYNKKQILKVASECKGKNDCDFEYVSPENHQSRERRFFV